jgi:hypothetical protein
MFGREVRKVGGKCEAFTLGLRGGAFRRTERLYISSAII